MQRQTLLDILEIARLYPSPHNSQPIKVAVRDDSIAVYYNLDHGLPAENFGVQFGYVCTGVFLASLRIAAAGKGFATSEQLHLTEMDFGSTDRNHFMGIVNFAPQTPTPEDMARSGHFMQRQTSRIPYDNKLIAADAVTEAQAIAASYGQELHISSDQTQVDKVIDVNQRTLFLDMQNDAVHQELLTWLRFSEAEAQSKADGLSAKTMLINGRVLRFAMEHRGLWELPLIGTVIKKIYLNTMRGVRQVAWITGPFNNLQEYVTAGKCFLDVWVALTGQGVSLHPYGTVITNPVSHKAFVEIVGQPETAGHMAWILFRLGYSPKPPVSYRRPLPAMIIEETT